MRTKAIAKQNDAEIKEKPYSTNDNGTHTHVQKLWQQQQRYREKKKLFNPFRWWTTDIRHLYLNFFSSLSLLLFVDGYIRESFVYRRATHLLECNTPKNVVCFHLAAAAAVAVLCRWCACMQAKVPIRWFVSKDDHGVAFENNDQDLMLSSYITENTGITITTQSTSRFYVVVFRQNVCCVKHKTIKTKQQAEGIVPLLHINRYLSPSRV